MGTGAHPVPRGGLTVTHGSKQYLLAATHPAGARRPVREPASNLS
jgi:hypothetical protein